MGELSGMTASEAVRKQEKKQDELQQEELIRLIKLLKSMVQIGASVDDVKSFLAQSPEINKLSGVMASKIQNLLDALVKDIEKEHSFVNETKLLSLVKDKISELEKMPDEQRQGMVASMLQNLANTSAPVDVSDLFAKNSQTGTIKVDV